MARDYTGIPYPFDKYDLVIVPGFQFGGMEHPGAVLYNDKRMFLGPHPTIEEELGRMELIAHETTHMWFGDAVTRPGSTMCGPKKYSPIILPPR